MFEAKPSRASTSLSTSMIMQLVAVSCASPPTGRFDGVPAEDVELTLSFGAKLNMTGGAYGWKLSCPCNVNVQNARPPERVH